MDIDTQRLIQQMTRLQVRHKHLREAAECVVATAFGNKYGMNENSQLEAIRMVVERLQEALE